MRIKEMNLDFFEHHNYLIIGENSALHYKKKWGEETVTLLDSITELSKIKNEGQPLDLYIDYQGCDYEVHDFPNLSSFELKQAIQNHPSLQGIDIISSSAYLAKNNTLNLCLIKKSEVLIKWLEILAEHHIPLRNINSFAFKKGLTLKANESKNKALYWISKTIDNTVRHVCILKGAIVFVRHTPLNARIKNEIEKTTQFIQRDYAVSLNEIEIINECDKQISPQFPSTKKRLFNWRYLENLPETLKGSFQKIKAAQHINKGVFGLKISNIMFASFSIFLLLKSTFAYFQESRIHTQISISRSSLPENIKDLSLIQLRNLSLLITNTHEPFKAIRALQSQHEPSFQLEEIHWSVDNSHHEHLKVSIRKKEGYGKKSQQGKLKELFKTPPRHLSSDQYVHRFELQLPQEER